MADIDIIPLLKDRYKGHEIPYDYDSEIYYDVRIHDTRQGFSADFVRMPFPTPKQKRATDTLFDGQWEMPEAYGVFAGETLIGVLEVTPESWNNRLRVINLWVEKDHRRQGIGKALLEKAKRLATARAHRAIVLETQTSNAGAIAFYFSQGFVVAGFDAYAYSNDDVERKEVRLELVFKQPRSSYAQG